jgi:peptidoglycan hydrolase-like protein with peptidoglycan-binding domain
MTYFETEMAGFNPLRRYRRNPARNLRRIQRALNAMLGANILPDGIMDSRTRRALRRFQRLNGIFDDGRLNSETASLLLPEVLSFEDALQHEGGSPSGPACGPYVAGEVQRSNTEAGHLPADFFPGPSGYRIIADFAVASSDIKRSVRTDANLKTWLLDTLQKALRDPSLKVKLLGYTDCVNKENRNTRLRAERARRVFELFASIAGSRWRKLLSARFTHGPAPPDQYIVDNSNPTNRATNRGVSIELTQVVTFKPEPGNCKVDVIHRAKNLLMASRTLQLMGKARVDRLTHIMRRISEKSTDDRFVMEEDVNNVARYGLKVLKWRTVSKYLDEFCKRSDAKDTPITNDEILHELWRLDNAFMNGICRLNEINSKPVATIAKFVMVASIRSLHATVFGWMTKVTSVYFGYQNALAECPTRGKTIDFGKRKPKKKDPQGGTPPKPDPKNQTVPTDDSIWERLKQIGKMTGILLSAAILLIPGGVVARAVLAARAVFLLRGFTSRQLIGMAGEKAAQVIAEWTLEKAGIDPSKLFDLNSIRPNFPGIDIITALSPISVKAYGIMAAVAGKEVATGVLSNYLSDFLRLCGYETYQESYRIRAADSLRQVKKMISKVGAVPPGLKGNIGVETIKNFVRDNTIFMIPDDHVIPLHRFAGNRLLTYYKQFGLPGIPSGLTDNAVAPRISKLLADRFKSIGVKSTDLQLMLKAAQK